MWCHRDWCPFQSIYDVTQDLLLKMSKSMYDVLGVTGALTMSLSSRSHGVAMSGVSAHTTALHDVPPRCPPWCRDFVTSRQRSHIGLITLLITLFRLDRNRYIIIMARTSTATMPAGMITCSGCCRKLYRHCYWWRGDTSPCLCLLPALHILSGWVASCLRVMLLIDFSLH